MGPSTCIAGKGTLISSCAYAATVALHCWHAAKAKLESHAQNIVGQKGPAHKLQNPPYNPKVMGKPGRRYSNDRWSLYVGSSVHRVGPSLDDGTISMHASYKQ